MELKNTLLEEGTVGRLILEGENLEEWRKDQKEDLGISFIYQSKMSRRRPSWTEVVSKDTSCRIY